MNPRNHLVNTRVLINGASSGIGHATALALQRFGASVISTVRRPTDAYILRSAGCQVEILDVRDYASQQLLLDKVGSIDVLINNAAISYRSSVEHGSDKTIREIFDTNFFAPCELMRRVLPTMRMRRNGAIINISSVSGRIAQPLNGYYSASKHALEAVTEALSYEMLPFNVRVLLIEPGRIRTRIHSRLIAESRTYADARNEYYKLGELLPPVTSAGESPDIVAQVIIEAILAPMPIRLRWPASPDAVDILSRRALMNDTEFQGYLFDQLNLSAWYSQP